MGWLFYFDLSFMIILDFFPKKCAIAQILNLMQKLIEMVLACVVQEFSLDDHNALLSLKVYIYEFTGNRCAYALFGGMKEGRREREGG